MDIQMQPNSTIPNELPNGATVLQAHIVDETTAVVLCYWEQDKSIVTWIMRRDDAATFHGHYFQIRSGRAVTQAADDFAERVARYR
jgi:hypothetical protein